MEIHVGVRWLFQQGIEAVIFVAYLNSLPFESFVMFITLSIKCPGSAYHMPLIKEHADKRMKVGKALV